MAFYFAWVNGNQTTFNSAFEREDEEVLAVEIAQEEGDFANMRIEIRNPRIGLLNGGRKRWAWLSHQSGGTTTPLFFGRLIGLPEELSDDVAVLSFIAKPQNFQAAKEALVDTMREPQYFDPMLIEKARRQEPDTVLEARPKVWHIDRITHAVTASHILHGSGGTIDFGSDPFFDSLRCRYVGAPQRKVRIKASVEWTQYGYGSVDVKFKGINTYTGDGLLEQWPQKGQSIGGGWTVLDGFAKDAFSSANTTNINDGTDETQYSLYLWTISGRVTCGYEAKRQYTEVATFTLKSDLQDIMTENGDEEPITLSLSGNADEPVDADDAMPIRDSRRRSYFQTDRGKKTIRYLANLAAARLYASARCVEISFTVPFSYAASLSLRKSGTIADPRLPGGTATGKIKSYRIVADGDSGEMSCEVTLGCAPGIGGSVSPSAGTPKYVADGYVASEFQAADGASFVAVTSATDEDALTVDDFDTIEANDDGLDLFEMTTRTCVLEKTVTNTSFDQFIHIYPNAADTNAAMNEHPTRLGIRLRPVNGGPFETAYAITCSNLMIPKQIDLEAAA